MTVEKMERGGQVAVLYSPGFGAGWSTWNDSYEEMLLFDKDIVNAVLSGSTSDAARIAGVKSGGDIYDGGADDLKVEWIDKGTPFRVAEYD